MGYLIGAFLFGLFVGIVAHGPCPVCNQKDTIQAVKLTEATHLVSVDDGVRWIGVCLPNGIIIAKQDDTE